MELARSQVRAQQHEERRRAERAAKKAEEEAALERRRLCACACAYPSSVCTATTSCRQCFLRSPS